MISDSFIKLIEKNEKYNRSFQHVTVFRETDLDKLDLTYVKNIFAPGMSVVPNTYPKNYKLFKDIERLKEYKFFPIGCSYQHHLPEDESFEPQLYDISSRQFLTFLNELTGDLYVRDEKINCLMKDIGVSSKYFGDLVLFDDNVIGEKYKGLKDINKIAFSVQHKAKYIEQSLMVLNEIRRIFPNAEIYVTFHGEENSVTDEIRNYARINDIECVALSGGSKNLDFYDDIDFHVGYRLHGHISFLRRRKPSVLVVEDARAYGFYKTTGTEFGCFNGLMKNRGVDYNLHNDIAKFLSNEINNDFMGYNNLFEFLDSQYKSVVHPTINDIVEKINE